MCIAQGGREGRRASGQGGCPGGSGWGPGRQGGRAGRWAGHVPNWTGGGGVLLLRRYLWLRLLRATAWCGCCWLVPDLPLASGRETGSR